MIYAFDGYELDTQLYELRKDEQLYPLERQVFDVLAYLVEHRDRVVPKTELLDQRTHAARRHVLRLPGRRLERRPRRHLRRVRLRQRRSVGRGLRGPAARAHQRRSGHDGQQDQELRKAVAHRFTPEGPVPGRGALPGRLPARRSHLARRRGPHGVPPSLRHDSPRLTVARKYENYPANAGSIPETRQAAIDSLNAGYNHVVHVGHGFRFNMSVGDASIVNADADALTNARVSRTSTCSTARRARTRTSAWPSTSCATPTAARYR